MICIGILSASLFFTIILRICLMIENRRRDRLSPEEYDCEASTKDSCDWVSLFLIILIFVFKFCSILASSSTIRLVRLWLNEYI